MRMKDSELDELLDGCPLEVREFVTALRAENLKLHRKIATLRATTVSLESRVAILEEKVGPEVAIRTMTDAELEAVIRDAERKIAKSNASE